MIKRHTFARSILLAGIGFAAMAQGSTAFAQDLAVEAADEDNTIIVTATKRQEDAQDVPIAITALGSKDIAASGVTGISDLRVAVPALNVTKGTGGFGLPRIRGLGATGQGNGIENPVAVYVDGVYYSAASGVLQSLFDTEQVAVLKGPQGTLFGRNATGGLIQINTLDPSLTDVRFKAELGYGNFETMRGAAFASAPLSDKAAISISGQWENRDEGIGVNRFTGKDVQDGRNYAMRAKLLWQPTEDTRIVLAGDFNGADEASPAFVPFGLNTAGQDVPTLITALGGDPRFDIYADVDPRLSARQRGTSLSVSHDFGGMSVKSVTAYRRTDLSVYFDPDGTTTPMLRILNENYDKSFTQELNLISDNSGPFKWIVGGFYMDNDAGQNPGRTTGTTQANAAGTTNTGYSDDINNVTLKSWSGFAEGTYRIGENTNITGGIRYTSDKRRLEAGATIIYNAATGVTTTTTTPIQERTFNKMSWKLSLDHRFSEEVMAYASYNRGFRAGTFVPQAARPAPVLEPETVDAYEIGIKTDLLDRRVRINLAGYYYDQSSVQVMQVIAGVQNVYSARGGAELYVIDGDITVQVSDNLRLFGGFAYNHSRYKSFTDAIISIPFPLSSSLGAAGAAAFSTTNYSYVHSMTGNAVANTVCQGTFVPPALASTQTGRDNFYRGRVGGNCLLRGDATGNRLQNTPDWTASFGGVLDIPSPIGKFSLGGNLAYNGGYVGTPDERVVQPSFTVVNASLTWRANNEHVYARVWGNNLTDAYYRTQIGASNSGANGTAGLPRTYGLTVGFDF